MTRIFPMLLILMAIAPSAFADIPKSKFALNFTTKLQMPISIRQGPQPVLVKKEPATPVKIFRWIISPLHIQKRPAAVTFTESFAPARPVVTKETGPRISFGPTQNQQLFGARIRLPNWSLRKPAPPKGID